MVLHVDRNGNEVRTTYNVDGNLVHLHMEHTDGEILADLYYSHDLNGNRTLKSGSRIGGEGKDRTQGFLRL